MSAPTKIQKLLAGRELARRRLLHFTKVTHGSYDAGWVHEDVCRRLEKFSQDVADGKSPRLMLLMPPRHGKSELASIRFPAWHFGSYPHHEIINVGYNTELPMKFSRKVREVMREGQYQGIFPVAALDPNSQSVEAWYTTAGGGFTAAGVGGGITGKGAHILVIDDPIKNQEEADSVTVRDKLWDWYQSTAYTRLAPGGGVLVIETWWNDDDLAGRLQDSMRKDPEADQFEIVKYPAISDQFEYRNDETNAIVCFTEDPELLEGDHSATKGLTLLRRPNECLHHGRYPLDALKRIKANLQPRIWSALYQQNPVPDEGMYFRKDYFREQQTFPQTFGLRIFTAWDFAIGEKQVNDWTVGATLLQDENDVLYVLDIHRFRGDSFQIVEAMLDTTERYSSLAGVDYQVGAEDGMIWRSIEPLLKRRMGERRLFPVIEPLRPITDKAARARPLQGRMQQGRVVFPAEAHWKGTAVSEMLRFPAGAHDDVVDALAWAVRLTMMSEPPQAPQERRIPSWRDKLTATAAGGSHMTA
jgi:predicted phage terminase large subunit-like protein